MSVRLWAYEAEKCDGDYCPNNCDKCRKAEDSENVPIWVALAMLNERKHEDEPNR